MQRDSQEALDRLDAIHRYERQLRRWVISPPGGVAEEDYDALHVALRNAEAALLGAYQQWHAIPQEAEDA